MEPVPETVAALRRLGRDDTGASDLGDLRALTGVVSGVVTSCVGMSISTVGTRVTLTFVDAACARELEPLGYLARMVEDDSEPLATHAADDPLDEQWWRRDAASTAPPGIASSLSLPVMDGESVSGSITFYAGEADAFDGHEQRLANLCGAWAPGAVANADLSFTSRLRAATAPRILQDQETVERATTVTSAALDVPLSGARRRMRAASLSAGISELALARLVLAAHDG